MAAEVRWLALFFVVFHQIYAILGELPHRRFEYKYSFKPPYLAQRDASVPFWEYGGNAIASEENVRLAPSLKSQKGGIWTKSKTNFDWWEVEIVFRVTGRGRVGADGLAFWYSAERGSFDGPVFGSSDKWIGLGIFFDSFDNDNKHNNPYISAVVNDGKKEFDHQNDGSTQLLAGCLRDFRNKPFPTRAKIEYYKNVLTVLFHNGMTNNEQDFEVCLRAENVFLPKYGHFGLTAATGGLADDHDALKFLTYSLRSQEEVEKAGILSQEEQNRLAREFQEHQQKLEQQKEEYKKDHPDAFKKDKGPKDYEEWYETDQQREWGQILAVQNHLFDTIRQLDRKFDEVIGRQERTLSLLSGAQAGSIAVPGGAPPPPGAVPMLDTIKRHEVDSVLANQREMVATIRDVKAFVGEVHQRTASILQNQGKATAHVQSVGGSPYDFQQLTNELRDSLNSMKRDVGAMAQKGGCPPPASCLSTTVFIVFIVIQLIILIGYSMYRDSKEAQAKKFY